MTGGKLTVSSDARAIEAFLAEAKGLPAVEKAPGRLIFAMDATASREASWRQAARLQEQMFTETVRLGGIAVQLVYYRGLDECRASRWLTDAASLGAAMRKIECEAGRTQIARVLVHALAEAGKGPLRAVVFVGDCFEEDEAEICDLAGRFALIGVPIFLFQEGADERAGSVFGRVAVLSGGAFCRFDAASPEQLRALLGGVAAFTAGGRQALADYSSRRHVAGAVEVLRLLGRQMGA